MVPPAQFLDIAEQTGLIHPLTTVVLEQAVRDCRSWLDRGLSLHVAVNLSARRLADPDLPGQVADLLARHRVPPEHLVLEITETAAMVDPARALGVLEKLRAVGVALSVDDFGTGHASLAYLSRLPVSYLKIDRSFVQTMEADVANLTIVRSTLDLARGLGLDVVAEGVETRSAYEALASFGCGFAQGYWLARPGPAAELPAVVEEITGRLTACTPAVPRRRSTDALPDLPRPRVRREESMRPA
jgi:EAL domain-containing protein (putative c-di-GMP-specific phosphodiesterase class I)